MPDYPISIQPSDVLVALKDTGKVIAHVTNFMVSVDRRKLPILALGAKEALGYGRGFRLVSGVMDYVQIREDLFMQLAAHLLEDGNPLDKLPVYMSKNEFDRVYEYVRRTAEQLKVEAGEDFENIQEQMQADNVDIMKTMQYTLDMLPPLDVIVVGVNEKGDASQMEILGLEFTSSSYAVTINDVAVAQRAEWVARSVLPWAKIELTAKSSQIPSTYTVNENQ